MFVIISRSLNKVLRDLKHHTVELSWQASHIAFQMFLLPIVLWTTCFNTSWPSCPNYTVINPVQKCLRIRGFCTIYLAANGSDLSIGKLNDELFVNSAKSSHNIRVVFVIISRSLNKVWWDWPVSWTYSWPSLSFKCFCTQLYYWTTCLNTSWTILPKLYSDQSKYLRIRCRSLYNILYKTAIWNLTLINQIRWRVCQ
jgi:hypothetical protein